MSHYSIDKCYLCGSNMHKADEYLNYCFMPECSYAIVRNKVEFSLNINDDKYFILIDFPAEKSVIDKQLIDESKEIYYIKIYEENNILNLSVEQWEKLIKRAEPLILFK